MTNSTAGKAVPDNLKIWARHEDINPKYTKAITGKDYQGTSPNAHHIIWCLTETFGPVGQGFGWRVIAESIDAFGDTSIHWCRIEFWHTDRENTFEAYGQTKMAYMTAKGFLKVDEDAPKKSLTDAITKAAAHIGIAANIFLGRWDDNKYVAQIAKGFEDESPPPQRNPAAVRDSLIKRVNSATDHADLNAKIGGAKFDAAWQWLAENHAGHGDAVRDAVNAARDKFTHADDLGGNKIPY